MEFRRVLFRSPDGDGKSADVLLGYDDRASYVDKPNYFAGTVGRYANRIAGGKFSLDGKAYQLTLNDGANSLHGGTRGFDRQVWRITAVKQGQVASVTLALTSPDGDRGYHGKAEATVPYHTEEHNHLTIHFGATAANTTMFK